MISDLINSVKDNLLNQLSSKFNLSPEQSDKAIEVSKDTLKDGLKEEAIKNPQGLLNLLNNKSEINQSNPIVENLISKYVGNLVSKVGLPSNIADSAAKFTVPFIVEKISNKFTGNGKTNNIQGLLGFLGIGDDLKDTIGKTLGDSSGKLSDLSKKIF